MGGTLVGVISDTHGLMRPEALRALAGVSWILHAGDVGAPEVLEALGAIAPVTAVRGNIDVEPWAAKLPGQTVVPIDGARVCMVHQAEMLNGEPEREHWQAVISGHSHKAVSEFRGGVLYLNPGSAGPRRFRLPVTLALLKVIDGEPQAEILTLMR